MRSAPAGTAGPAARRPPPAFRTPSSATTSSQLRSRQTPPAPPARRQARAGGAPAGSRARSARRTSALVPERDRHRVGRARGLRLEELVERRPARVLLAVWFHSSRPAPLRLAQQRQRRDRLPRPLRGEPPAAATRWREHPLDRRPARRGRCCRPPHSTPPSPASCARQREIELRRHQPPGRRALILSSPEAPACVPGTFCSDEHHLEERRVAQAPLRLQLLDQLLEGQLLVRVRAQRASRTRRSSSRKLGSSARGRARSTSVLTKKPISPSISARVRSAIGLPTTTSSLPV